MNQRHDFQEAEIAERPLIWYALRVETRATTRRRYGEKMEFPAARALRVRGFDPFIPVESHWIQRTRFHRRDRARVQRAILPGVVFVPVEDNAGLWPALTAPYVRGLWSIGGTIRIPAKAVDRLKAISDSLYRPDFYRPMPTNRGYEVGDTVEVLDGTFGGPVTVTAIAGERARFLVSLFGADREVETHASNLAKAAE